MGDDVGQEAFKNASAKLSTLKYSFSTPLVTLCSHLYGQVNSTNHIT